MEFYAVFFASLLGSLHCAAMCGGLAGFCAAQSARALPGSISYHLGRCSSYAALGAIAGAGGAGFGRILSEQGISSRGASIVVGGLLLLWGLTALYTGRAPTLYRAFAQKISQRIAATLRFARVRELPPVVIGATTGVLTIFLPCGWLYAFVLLAAGSGSAEQGAILMAAFWAGSVPALALIAAGAKLLRPTFLRLAPRLGACMLVLAGLSSIFAREDMMALLPHAAQHQQAHTGAGASSATAAHAGRQKLAQPAPEDACPLPSASSSSAR